MADENLDVKKFILKSDVEESYPDSRTVVHFISTDSVDKHAEVIIQDGVDLSHYRQNPIVLYDHETGKMPVGKNLWIRTKSANGKTGLVAKTKFANTPRGQECFELYADRVLDKWSVGLYALEQSPPTKVEKGLRADWANCRNVVRKSRLREYSVVPIAANDDAVTIAVNKGMKLPEWVVKAENSGDHGGKQEPADVGNQEPPTPAQDIFIPKGRRLADIEKSIERRIKTFDFHGLAISRANETLDRHRGRV